jgi:hypothetical protein
MLSFGQIYPVIEGAGEKCVFLKSFFYSKRERERDSGEFSIAKTQLRFIGSNLPFFGGFVNTFFTNSVKKTTGCLCLFFRHSYPCKGKRR